MRKHQCKAEKDYLRKDLIIDMQNNIALQFRIDKGVTWAGKLTQNKDEVQDLRNTFDIVRMCSTEFMGDIV